jgi:hypothetical protein
MNSVLQTGSAGSGYRADDLKGDSVSREEVESKIAGARSAGKD